MFYFSRNAPAPCYPQPCNAQRRTGLGGVGPRVTGANLRICRKKSQIRRAVATAVARTSGRSDRPASDLEMDTLEVTGYIAFLNVVALKNKPDHQVDADGEHR